jgi:hypothetical protein
LEPLVVALPRAGEEIAHEIVAGAWAERAPRHVLDTDQAEPGKVL